jgi:hypothetical protein
MISSTIPSAKYSCSGSPHDFRARLGRIEGKLNRILDRVYPEEAEERQKQARLAFDAKVRREGLLAWPLLVLWLLGVGAWFLLRS